MMLSASDQDTICAIATAPGRAGVGVVRVSGPLAGQFANSLLGFQPTPRHAHYGAFRNAQGEVLDQGIAIYFPAPNSFTGEDVLELQGHGGHYLLNTLIETLCQQGARIARPGEFSERAFLNNKIDLAQAEAIADLIDSSSAQAARSALRTLQGEFSRRVHALAEAITELRVYVEAAIDFSDEEIDFLSEGGVATKLTQIIRQLAGVLEQARQGAILRDGMSVVIAGKPNAGKSSLLNALSGRDSAIVTDIAGTTRDVLTEHIHIDGMPLHIIDTAGLRESDDRVEQEGIRRAHRAIRQADRLLLVIDASNHEDLHSSPQDYLKSLGLHDYPPQQISIVINKIDLSGQGAALLDETTTPRLLLSARSGTGMDLLRQHLKQCMGYSSGSEDGFIARNRHLDALRRANEALQQADQQLRLHQAGELVAEDLRQAHRCLGEITGEFSTDDLLGRIFSSFCIGK